MPKPCVKKSYFTESAARLMLADIDRRRRTKGKRYAHRRETHYYQCEECGFWHLASDPKRKHRKTKKGKRKCRNV